MPSPSTKIRAVVATLTLASWAAPTAAEDAPRPPPAASGAPQLACPGPAVGPIVPPAPDRSKEPVIIYARELDAGKTSVGEARGDVEMFRADQHLRTERFLYDPLREVVSVPGAVEYEDQQVWFEGREARYSFLEETGEFRGIRYGLTGSSANGHAEEARLVGGHTSILRGVDYTTCPEGTPDWLLSAKELELRHEEGFGTARGAKLVFRNVPVLYAPWFTFPIDDRRKTGFLYPNLGQNSDSGLEIGIPWYWNIAPNQDATLEPHYFSRRGLMLYSQYRFLTRRTEGTLELDYMPDDRLVDGERHYYKARLGARPSERWRADALLERVSDDRYFQDFGTNLGQTALQFLRSYGALSAVGRYWDLQLVADAFQVIDEAVRPENEPYKRLPRLSFRLDQPLGGSDFYLGLDSEAVYFQRDEGVTGARVDLAPRLYWDGRNDWGFLRPSVALRYIGYGLDMDGQAGDDSPSVSTPIYSIDSGIVMDRRTASGDLQTLEPRIFYLYVPYDEQSGNPVFDTGEFTFGYSQLFNTNRFAGGDRQGDANQLSLGVSTRRFDGASGKVLWSLSLGQIFYFDRQRVQLDEAPVFDKDTSPFLAEFRWRPFAPVSASIGAQWDWDLDQLDVGMLGIEYRSKRGLRSAFEYRYRRDRVDQFDLRVLWPVTERWRLLTRFNYSFSDRDMLEFQGGVEYESCCWALRTVLRRYLKNRAGEYRDTIFIELNLKGLASIGSRGARLFGN